MAVMEQVHVPPVIEEVDERAARRTLRDQIARLEREVTAAALDACPRLALPAPMRSLAGPFRLRAEVQGARAGAAADEQPAGVRGVVVRHGAD